MDRVYDAAVKRQMCDLCDSLGEKDRRRYAAIEAAKLPHGGNRYIADLFGCHVDTLAAGRRDL